MLLLGESERTREVDTMFGTLDAKHRIYKPRALPAAGLPLGSDGGRNAVPPPRRFDVAPPRSDGPDTLRDSLIRLYAPPSLVIDDRDEVIEVIGDVSRWCWVADGRHSAHVTALLRGELQAGVRTLLLRLRRSIREPEPRRIRLSDGAVVVTARRLAAPHGGYAVLSFDPVIDVGGTEDGDGGGAALHDETAGPDDEGRDREDQVVHEALQATIEELASSNEEMQALNEELQASSEELSASNEELEATNEELSTLNEELQIRSAELTGANADLENLQASLSSGIIVVDRELRVRRFNSVAVRLFALIDSDVGRPLTAIPMTAPVPELEKRLRAVIESSHGEMLEVPGEAAESLLQLQPYRVGDGSVHGVVLIITDITPLTDMRHLLRQSLRDLENVTESLREMVWLREPGGTLRVLNGAVETLFGLDRSAVRADPSLLLAAVHPDDRDRVQTAAASAKRRWQIEYRIVRPNGEIRWVEESAIAQPAEGNDPGYVVASVLDVTERNEALQSAIDQRRVFRSLFDNELFGVVVLDAEGRITAANDTFAAITGYVAASLVGMTLTDIATPETGRGRESRAKKPEPLTPGIQQRRLVTRDSTPHWVTLDVRPLETLPGNDAASIVILHDVTEMRSAGDELATQAHFDAQTGLANRAWFRERLTQEMSRAERNGRSAALLWVDLDEFKDVNDGHGHQAGDVVLRTVASRLQALVRKEDLVGRLGGDEFALLATDLDGVEGIEILVERVLAELRRPIDLEGLTLFVSGSIGVAVAPADGRHPDELLANADAAMYCAKEAGRDCHAYFAPAMNDNAMQRTERRTRLATALRSREFVMHYQPIVDPTTTTMYAAEALVRWSRDGEIIAAAEFIDLAEQTGQIRSLGRIILDLVRGDMETLSNVDGLGKLPITVNFSATQLDERSFLDLLLAWDVPGGFERLIVELTESVLLERGGKAFDAITVLRRVGATICIDDFGTGYSSLENLELLHPGIIKLDRTLLEQSTTDKRRLALLRVAVEFAHSLDAAVVLEGVETEQQRLLAIDLGVEWVQGYHLARPMPIEDLTRWAALHIPA